MGIVAKRVIVLLLALPPVAVAMPLDAATAPDVIVVNFDDATKADVEAMPNVQSLIAQQGATFDNFFATDSLCCPSRSSFLVGEYVHNHGIASNNAKTSAYPKFRRTGQEQRTIARAMQEQGYHTGLFGKYLNGYLHGRTSARHHIAPYWSRWFASFLDDKNSPYYDYDVSNQGRLRHYGHNYIDAVIARRAEHWLDVADPAFAYIAPRAPHAPYTLPPRHKTGFETVTVNDDPSLNEADVSDKPAYVRARPLVTQSQINAATRRRIARRRMMLETDDLIGRLVAKHPGAYFFVMSDNGWMEGQHRLPAQKIYPYDPSIKLPLLVRGPGISAGIHIPQLASMADLFATLSDIAGPEVARDGRSLLPLLDGTVVTWRTSLLVESFVGSPAPPYSELVTPQSRYVRYSTGEEEFYDLSTDPYEQASDPNLVTPLMKQTLDAFETCSGDSCRVADSMLP